ncbi:hypothetical protein QJS04_geneDACA017681 [Acorus gramineus]|uniref:Uncharacterized protein n=1 Tax=Acorus gramineus TaxID=55184 RepID=A0AAV9BUP1_ACOGR|nr:hypothetical protein QJS04_geneDACA017681 [Acorus gramineus]
MDQYRYLLIDRVRAHQKVALLPQVLLLELVLHPLLCQRYPHPQPERAHSEIQQRHPLHFSLELRE